MAEGVVGLPLGDRNDEWRRSYSRVRKDLLAGEERTNRRRLAAMGAESLDRAGTWLDLGAGDGNVAATLSKMGVARLVAVEYQHDLVVRCPPSAARVVASADRLPFADRSMDVALAMDVLHHLTLEQLSSALEELRRVLEPGGVLLVCEPSPTIVRRVLHPILMGPAGSLSQFSRDKRTLVRLEADTLLPWLADESSFVGRAGAAGFVVERSVRRPLHTLRRFRRR